MLTLAFSGIVERLTLRVDVLDDACVRWILREEHLDSLDGSGELAQEALITTCPDQLILPSGEIQPPGLRFEPRTQDLERVLLDRSSTGDFLSVGRILHSGRVKSPEGGPRFQAAVSSEMLDRGKILPEYGALGAGWRRWLFQLPDEDAIPFEEAEAEGPDRFSFNGVVEWDEWPEEGDDEDDDAMLYLPRLRHNTLYFNQGGKVLLLDADIRNEQGIPLEPLMVLNSVCRKAGIDAGDVTAVRAYLLEHGLPIL